MRRSIAWAVCAAKASRLSFQHSSCGLACRHSRFARRRSALRQSTATDEKPRQLATTSKSRVLQFRFFSGDRIVLHVAYSGVHINFFTHFARIYQFGAQMASWTIQNQPSHSTTANRRWLYGFADRLVNSTCPYLFTVLTLTRNAKIQYYW